MSYMRIFEMPRTERVIEGPGALAGLPAELDRQGLGRALILSGRTLGASEPFGRLLEDLGERAVAVHTEVQAHNPLDGIMELVALARDTGAEAVIGIGGGSAIDAAKLTSLGVSEKVDAPRDFLRFSLSHGPLPLAGTPLPTIAVPTTLSAAEWNGVAAFVDSATSRKELCRYLELTPATVVLDPALSALTPRRLWTTTGVRAIDHAVEIAYAKNAHPFTTALCMAALKILASELPRTARDPEDFEAGLRCHEAAWMSLVGVHNVPVGLSHAIGHQLGAAGVPHGVTSCVTLPHVMRFFEPATREQQNAMAEILAEARCAPEARSAADEIELLFMRLDVPRRISEFNLSTEALETVVEATMSEAEAVINQAPRPVTAEDVRLILAQAR